MDELDALQPPDLIEILTDAIDQVIDVDAYNQELAAEEAFSGISLQLL